MANITKIARDVAVALVIVTVILGIVTCATLAYITMPFDTQLVTVKLELETSVDVYLRREMRGLLGNYDEMALSTDPGPCEPIDYEMDYVFKGSEPSFGLAYRSEGGILHVYEGFDQPIAPPQSATSFPIKIVRHSRALPTWVEHESQQQARLGYKQVNVEFDESPCNSYIRSLLQLGPDLVRVLVGVWTNEAAVQPYTSRR